jgi:hypothetical protein
MVIVDPAAPTDVPTDFTDHDDLGPEPDTAADDDETPSDLDTNPHTPL